MSSESCSLSFGHFDSLSLCFFGFLSVRVENFRGRGAQGQPFPPGPGRGGAGRASLVVKLCCFADERMVRMIRTFMSLSTEQIQWFCGRSSLSVCYIKSFQAGRWSRKARH